MHRFSELEENEVTPVKGNDGVAAVLGDRRTGTEDTTNDAARVIIMVIAAALASTVVITSRKKKKEDEV